LFCEDVSLTELYFTCRVEKVGKSFAKVLGDIDAKRMLRQVFIGHAWL